VGCTGAWLKRFKKKNPNAVALGKLGGSKGGKIRAARLTPERRSEIARKAVLARWAKAKESKKKEEKSWQGNKRIYKVVALLSSQGLSFPFSLHCLHSKRNEYH
jgi:hypothetical protein